MKFIKIDMFGGEGGKDIFIGYNWKGVYIYVQMFEEVVWVECYFDENCEKFYIIQVYFWYSEQEGSSIMVIFDIEYVDNLFVVQELLCKGLLCLVCVDYVVGNQGGDGGGGGNQLVQVQLVGDLIKMFQEIGEEVLFLLVQCIELCDVCIDNGEKGSELVIYVDCECVVVFGFNVEQVVSFVGLVLCGVFMCEFCCGDIEVLVWVCFVGVEQSSFEDLVSFIVCIGDGCLVLLLSLVDVMVKLIVIQIGCINCQIMLIIKVNFVEKVMVFEGCKVMEEVFKFMSFLVGYIFIFDGGDYGDDNEVMQQMMFNLLIVLVMIYVVMVVVFELLLFLVVIMSGVLFLIFGVFWLFWLIGILFGIMFFIGILVLMGVVVNNGIVMIEYINNLCWCGVGCMLVLVEGLCECL